MKKSIVIIGLIVSCATVSLTGTVVASGAVRHADCVEGVKKINGVNARTFCGPARATVRVNGKTITYKGGECGTGLGQFSVNIGTVVLGTLKNKPDYFGVAAVAKPGTHARQTVAVVHAGKTLASIGTVTLKRGLRSGTFSGTVFGSSTVVSGSFTC
jgi:hypothetical protein